MDPSPFSLVWFRRDLRLADHPALHEALATGAPVIPCYIHAPDEEAPWIPGAASRWWLHGALASLERELRMLGSRLVIRRGPTAAALDRLILETGAARVHWNRLYEPALTARDHQLKAALKDRGIEARSFNAALLAEPWMLATQAGAPFRVFTPFWNALARRLDEIPPPLPRPANLPAVATGIESESLADLALLPRLPWPAGLEAAWQPDEASGLAALESLADAKGRAYSRTRDLPGIPGTARVSPQLHFGQLGPRQVLHRIRAAQRTGSLPAAAADAFLRQMGWRDFAHHLLFHFPETPERPFQPAFAALPARTDPEALERWQRGKTGIPIVDAGMRELWTTGWMHNRVRMLVASFLTKNLGLPWLEGARWFWDTLVDADLANNTLGWQWTAGCGADAAPYYRIFNPVVQAERFDPDGTYQRRWVPELARLDNRWLPKPWEAPAEALEKAGVRLGETYPRPMVDLKASRARALADYHRLRASK